jgi:mono/diheme cytochrome c family protein
MAGQAGKEQRQASPLVWWGLAVAAVAGVGVATWWQVGGAPAVRIDPNDRERVAQGRAVYQQHCASCHGAKLEGQAEWRTRLPSGRMPAPPHDASGHTWHHPGDVLFGIVKEGVQKFAPAGYQSDMPAYAGVLSDAQIVAVLSYIKSTWPDEVRRRHDELERVARNR